MKSEQSSRKADAMQAKAARIGLAPQFLRPRFSEKSYFTSTHPTLNAYNYKLRWWNSPILHQGSRKETTMLSPKGQTPNKAL